MKTFSRRTLKCSALAGGGNIVMPSIFSKLRNVAASDKQRYIESHDNCNSNGGHFDLPLSMRSVEVMIFFPIS